MLALPPFAYQPRLVLDFDSEEHKVFDVLANGWEIPMLKQAMFRAAAFGVAVDRF